MKGREVGYIEGNSWGDYVYNGEMLKRSMKTFKELKK